MKIATWNCNMAFRNKAVLILEYNPDILVIPECEHPDKIMPGQIGYPNNFVWFGHNSNKGLGVLSYNDYKIEILDFHNPDFRTILPIRVTGPYVNFTLFAIWANNTSDADGHYIEQVWKAINFYSAHIGAGHVVLAGDFNSNTIWDKKRRIGNHSHVVSRLEDMQIHSCYHRHYAMIQGKEVHPTFYLHRNRNKSYHIDYCFASQQLLSKLAKVEIGDYDDWIKVSDHVPLIMTIND